MAKLDAGRSPPVILVEPHQRLGDFGIRDGNLWIECGLDTESQVETTREWYRGALEDWRQPRTGEPGRT